MTKDTSLVALSDTEIQARILPVRGVQVMFDRDIAALYGVETKVLNQAVKRNSSRNMTGNTLSSSVMALLGRSLPAMQRLIM